MAIITFVENIIYQNPNEQPTNIAGSPYGLNTITEDVDPYIKKYTVGPLNTPIDLGWLEDCAGMIFVHNCSENGTLFINDLGILIPPRATARFWPTKYDLNLCSDRTDTKAYITILPK